MINAPRELYAELPSYELLARPVHRNHVARGNKQAALRAINVNVISIVLTSAVVSALVTSAITLFGQHFERNARTRELLFTKSVELAKAKTEWLTAYAKDAQKPVYIAEYGRYAEMYYWLLSELHDHGKLPKNWKEHSRNFYGIPTE